MTYELRSNTITFEAALRDLGSSRPQTRAQAAHALGDVSGADERTRAVPALVEALADERMEVRAEAALSLGELEDAAAVEPLVASIDDTVPAVRQSAVIALGRLGYPAAFDAVARALRKGPPDVRFQAATTLAELDAERAREPLRAALDDSDGEVVGAAAVALGAIGDADARPRLAALLETWSTPQTRLDIAYALAELGDVRAVDVLGGVVDLEPCAWDAIEALERLGTSLTPPGDSAAASDPEAGADDAGGAPALLGGDAADPATVRNAAATYIAPLLRKRFKPTLKLRAAAAVLALDPDNPAADSARRTLLTGLRARRREQRGLAIELLGRVGDHDAALALERLASRRAGRPFGDEIAEAVANIRARNGAAHA